MTAEQFISVYGEILEDLNSDYFQVVACTWSRRLSQQQRH